MELTLTPLTYLLLTVVFVLLVFTSSAQTVPYLVGSKGKCLSRRRRPPGPWSMPLLGNLLSLGKYETLSEAFADLRSKYGDVFSLQLGSQRCVVVSSFPVMKEVLIKRGVSFSGRPNFLRYHRLFGGDRDNSLALCDWSDLQKTRRSIAHSFMFPRPSSQKGDLLEESISRELDHMMEALRSRADECLKPKFLLLRTCANIFCQYLCSQRFDSEDEQFQKMVREFDFIFYDINKGYAFDFLPWISCFYSGHFAKLEGWSKSIRKFIRDRIISVHCQEAKDSQRPTDMVDALITHVKEEGNDVGWEIALFELEDLLGGSSAVGNFWMQALVKISSLPDVLQNIQKEISEVTGNERPVCLEDRPRMPYTEATIMESLRTISSPIVPHVAVEDTQLTDFHIPSGTMVFLDNHDLNNNPRFWKDPHEFDPSRFVKLGKLSKPEYFIPFSTGKRACMGHRLVSTVTFLGLARILQEFSPELPGGVSSEDLPKGCLALPFDTFSMVFSPRQ